MSQAVLGQVLSCSGWKTQPEGQGWTTCAFTVRQQANRVLGLFVPHYLKMGFILLNISLLMVGHLSNTHLNFSLSQEGEMGGTQSRLTYQRRLTFAWRRRSSTQDVVPLFSGSSMGLKLLVLPHAQLQLTLPAPATTGLAGCLLIQDSEILLKQSQNFPYHCPCHVKV